MYIHVPEEHLIRFRLCVCMYAIYQEAGVPRGFGPKICTLKAQMVLKTNPA